MHIVTSLQNYLDFLNLSKNVSQDLAVVSEMDLSIIKNDNEFIEITIIIPVRRKITLITIQETFLKYFQNFKKYSSMPTVTVIYVAG